MKLSFRMITRSACILILVLSAGSGFANHPEIQGDPADSTQNISSRIFRVLVLNFDPIIESQGNSRLHEVLSWNDPHNLAEDYMNDLNNVSNSSVKYQIVQWTDADEYPALIDGFQYTDDSYLTAWYNHGPWHTPDMADYYKIISDYNIEARIASGEIDEVFMFGAPYFGFYESRMAGPGAYDVNSPGMPDVNSSRLFIMMGFSYERGVESMLEDYGHRTESIMTHVYGSWNIEPKHTWDNFTLYEQYAPGNASCGNVHYAPNAIRAEDDYDYGNPNYVWSTCDDWLYNWPYLEGTKKWVNASEWGGGSARSYFIWWFRHLPNRPGINQDGRQNSWWKYVADFNCYPESGGRPGACAQPPIALCGPDKLKCETKGAPVQFNASASYDPDGTITSYNWEFGDGTNGTGVAPKHVYQNYRWNDSAYLPFIANLTVTDNSASTNRTSQKVVVWMPCDTNGDGRVNILDASVIGLRWRSADVCADTNNDGRVDILDAACIGRIWGKTA